MSRTRFFDSPPTNQSRLLTFGCPKYRETDEADSHAITIAWKADDSSLGEEVTLLAENAPYEGKPLALMPDAIKNYQGEFFPKGTFYITCKCMPKKEGKICYVAAEVIDTTQLPQTKSKEPGQNLKATKKISKDIQASTQMLVQLYDVVEEINERQARFEEKYIAKLEQGQRHYSQLLLEKLTSNMAILEECVLSTAQNFQKMHDYLQASVERKSNETMTFLSALLSRMIRVEQAIDLRNKTQDTQQTAQIELLEQKLQNLQQNFKQTNIQFGELDKLLGNLTQQQAPSQNEDSKLRQDTLVDDKNVEQLLKNLPDISCTPPQQPQLTFAEAVLSKIQQEIIAPNEVKIDPEMVQKEDREANETFPPEQIENEDDDTVVPELSQLFEEDSKPEPSKMGVTQMLDAAVFKAKSSQLNNIESIEVETSPIPNSETVKEILQNNEQQEEEKE